MTVSILQTLATLPSGEPGMALTLDELGRYLAEQCDTPQEKERNARHALRDELYRDGGVAAMKLVIDDVFKDPTVRELRKKWVQHARFNNALKRIVNELSTVYAEPATRIVKDDANNARYQALLDAVRMDEQALKIGRLLNLHRALLVGIRVRVLPDDTREPVIDVATPANVRAVLHPNDNTLVVGWLIKTCHRSARPWSLTPDAIEWTLWTDHEVLSLTSSMRPIAGTYKTHDLGVCPWVPVSLGPSDPGFWPGEEGEDLISAHMMIMLTNVLLLKEEKSATKQTIISGDTTAMARAQAADSEMPIEAAEGTVVNTVDMSMDLEMFRGVADHILETVGHNYGIAPALLRHQGVQSADARELMRVPLRELRKQQQIPLRRWELRFAVVMSAVIRAELGIADMTFEVKDWRIEFGESQTPLSQMESLTVFEKARTLGVDDTIEFLKRQHPGLSTVGAAALMEEHIAVETRRVHEMRDLQAMSGGTSSAAPDPNSGPDSLPGETGPDNPPPEGNPAPR